MDRKRIERLGANITDVLMGRYTRQQLSELSGLSGRQIDTLKDIGFITISKRRYDLKSLIICVLAYEYNRFFGLNTLTNDCKDFLRDVNKCFDSDYVNTLLTKYLIFGYLEGKGLRMIILAEDVARQIIDVNTIDDILVKNREEDITTWYSDDYINGVKVGSTNEVTIFNSFTVSFRYMLNVLQSRYRELYIDDQEIA